MRGFRGKSRSALSSAASGTTPAPNEWAPGRHNRVLKCHDLARLYFRYDDGSVFEISFCRAVHITQCTRCWIWIRNCFLSHLLQKKDMAYRFWVRDGVRNGLFQLST
ncbi:MICOS complex subunit MIC10 isoform X1 [Harpia harpyja]|uniref:MICOS complex subunit MIC10 isoform X1 n=1 Tax=Harpia harpyja TaxID=202280 RepID=UPI0022B1B322|nr:MICOS complex subunit MIC10 isoform X1 [Harpia harpyja]XP_052649566.1 MICOS complex subunit MIC10 isoform X1 [Harpia harpyja]